MKPSWADPNGPDYQSVFDVVRLAFTKDKTDVSGNKKRPEDEDEDDDERKRRDGDRN